MVPFYDLRTRAATGGPDRSVGPGRLCYNKIGPDPPAWEFWMVMSLIRVAVVWRFRREIGILIALLTLLVAAGAAWIAGPSGGQVVAGVETAASASGAAVNALAAGLPLGYAFGAGMVAAVNPCGFVLLPAYLGLYLGADSLPNRRAAVVPRIARALEIGGVVSLGFVLLFGVTGLVLGAATAAIAGFFPWLGLAVGIVLIFVGGWLIGGGFLYSSLGSEIAGRFGGRIGQTGVRSYFAFGLAYGASSLSCTLPIFLAVVGSAFAANNYPMAAFQFVLYALGMGFVITLLTLATAFFQQAVERYATAALQYIHPLSAIFLLLAGAYLVYYWLTIGGLLAGLGAG